MSRTRLYAEQQAVLHRPGAICQFGSTCLSAFWSVCAGHVTCVRDDSVQGVQHQQDVQVEPVVTSPM